HGSLRPPVLRPGAVPGNGAVPPVRHSGVGGAARSRRLQGRERPVGHQAGDEVLRQMADLIRAHVRGADIPCRVGGDEFAVILTDTPKAEALLMAQRLRVGVANWFSTHEVHGHMLNLTMSGGVGTMPLDADGADELYAGADLALYEAKRRGANQVSAV